MLKLFKPDRLLIVAFVKFALVPVKVPA
jgi:hypothetical protein